MDKDLLVRVDGLSKKFCRSLKRSLWYGVQDIFSDMNPFANGAKHNGHVPTQREESMVQSEELRSDEFWAVENVSFELRRGQCLGLIGRNGAGKTTLLRVLNGLIKPDRGRIEMRGRVGGLISLGAGFNPILTGRENIYVNAAVLGLSKREVDGKIEDIIEFAEIRDFIDSPVQNYSSGMQIRLGFAVATALEPDVLLLDEVLAVGDAAFRNKCYARIGDLQKRAAVIFVSHVMDQVARTCSSGLYLENGRTVGALPVNEAIQLYDKATEVAGTGSFCEVHAPVTNATVEVENGQVSWGQDLLIALRLECESEVKSPYVLGVFYDSSGAIVGSYSVKLGGSLGYLAAGPHKIQICVEGLHLATGDYWIGLNFGTEGNIAQCVWSYKELKFRVNASPFGLTSYRPEATVFVDI